MDEIIIREDLVLVNETVQSSEEIIRKLGKLLLEEKYVKDSFIEAVLDREKIFPTGLQTTTIGFAIPHTDAEHVLKSTVAIATLKSPVIFMAMGSPEDEISVSIVMILAISDPKKVIDTLTKVISILQNEATIDELINATTKLEIQGAFNEHMHNISD
jgi:PTS system galactitol-specific IIA component